MTTLARGLLAALCCLPAFAAVPTALGQGAGPDEPVVVRAEASVEAVAPGEAFAVAVVFELAEKWHINAHDAVAPPELAGFAPIRTSIDASASPGRVGRVQWPEMHEVTVDFGTGDATLQVYEGTAIAYLPVQAPSAAEPGSEVTVAITVEYQACDDAICLAPEMPEFTLVVPVAAETSETSSSIFGGYAGSDWEGAELSPDEAGVAETPGTAPAGSGSGDGARFLGVVSLPSGSGPAALAALAVLAALGGFILNMTPCVLPVIPIKVMTLTQHAGENKAKALTLGMAMALGVVAFWFALGVPAALVASFADPSRVFGYWFVTIPLGVLMVFMSLGLMGMFNLTLPQGVYGFNPKADSPGGSFLYGVMTGVLGLPCFGFVAGALIPASINFGEIAVVVIFTSMGIGMAAPYLLLSAFPKLLAAVPRTGPASDLVKQFLGLLLIGFGLFFFGTGVLALVKTYPYTSEIVHIYGLSLAILAAGGWLAWKTLRITSRPIPRVLFALVGAGIAVFGVNISVGATVSQREEWQQRQTALASLEKQILPGVWNEYDDPELLEMIAERGDVAFIDFTADWCINCKVFEAQVLDKEPVKSTLTGEGVVKVKVDLTGSNRAGERLLDDLGRVGIPTWAVVGPGVDEPIVIDTFTAGAVLDAIERARGGSVATAD